MNSPLSHFAKLARGDADWVTTFFAGGLSIFLLTTCINQCMVKTVDVDNYSGGFDSKIQWIFLLLCVLSVGVAWWSFAMSRCVARFQREQRSFLMVFVSLVFGIAFLGDVGRVSIDVAKDWLQTWQTNISKPMAAAQISTEQKYGRITVRGDIGLGSYDALERAIQKNPELNWIDIQSSGGYVVESLAMAKLIERHRLNTLSLNECLGACTVVFAAGVQRHLGLKAQLGFLRLGNQAARYFLARGTAAFFVTAAVNGPANKVWMAETWQALQAGFATRLVYPNGVLVAQ